MDPKRRGNMVRRLPKGFRQKLYWNYQKKFQIPGSAFDKVIEEATDEDAMSIRRREGGDFERRIGTQDDIPEAVGECIKKTISWPSTSQSLKGVLTGGPTRSWKYLQEKRQKSKLGRAQKEGEKKEPKQKEE
jgi:translocator assembly and maintenance protein 41